MEKPSRHSGMHVLEGTHFGDLLACQAKNDSMADVEMA